MKKISIVSMALAFAAVLFGYYIIQQAPTNNPETSSDNKSAAKPASDHKKKSGSGLIKHGRSLTAHITVSNKPANSTVFARKIDGQAVTADGKKYPLLIYRALAVPNDPVANQTWVNNANISGAWDIPQGNTPTLLAIIDTGFALQHEELSNRWYTNPNEQPNGIDDDGNGLVDDVRGWDFANFDNSVQAESTGRHGTYVAGVAAATGNNSKGIAGVDWGTTVLPLQALGEAGTGYNVDVANAITYAADQGADVISLSLGSSGPDPLVRQAVQYAITQGSIVVAAAGNDGCDCMVYPANYPEVLAVGATDNNNQPANFSSYGVNLDILAPGVNLYTTDWQPANPTGAYTGGISGTSLATPIISGLLTRLKSLRPAAKPLELIAALTENVNRLNLASTTSRSNNLGFGLTDGGRATQRLSMSFNSAQSYVFSPLSLGDKLSPDAPAEPVGLTLAMQCENGKVGTTPIYELNKGGTSFFSASMIEVQQALSQGYSTSFFSYTCLSQQHDTHSSIRTINIWNEFRNTPKNN